MLLKDADHVEFHHNLVDNLNDDGIEPGPKKQSQHIRIYQNVISRCLNPFTAHGNRTEPTQSEPGSGVFIYRNLVDLRRGTYKTPPDEPDASGAYLDEPTTWLGHDHGSPTHPDYYVYHNTFLLPGNPGSGIYLWTWSGHLRDTTRRVFNNIFVQEKGLPGLNVSAITPKADFAADANLLWSRQDGRSQSRDYFAKLRRSLPFQAGWKHYPSGIGANDQFADPRFFDSKDGASVRLREDSPAIDAGVPLPPEWPDPLRTHDQGKPDLGAYPRGA